MERYNGWEDPIWRDYWGMNDDDNYDEDYIDEGEEQTMRDINRINEVLAALKENWEKVPDWRLGQLLCNLQSAAGNDLFYVEDDKFIELLEEYFNKGEE